MRESWSVLAVACCALAGCNSVTAPVDAVGTLFEIEYHNYAWVPTYYGYVIDAEGTIHRFDLQGGTWDAGDDEWFSERELESKWARSEEVTGEVSRSVLAAMAELAEDAAAGKLSQAQNRCADAGTLTYSAYLFDPQRGELKRVVLRHEGDRAQLNQSDDARALVEWLESLDLLPPIEGCQPG